MTPVRATTPSEPQINRRVGAANSVLFIAKYGYYSKLHVWGAPGAVGSTKQAVLVTPVRATPPSNPQINRRRGAANSILFIAKYSYYS